MPSFVIHTIPGSPFAAAALATLEEKKAEYRVIAIEPGTLKQRPHLDLHPFGRMPVLDHVGFILYETQAILRYLDRVLPEPRLTPSDPKQAARMDQIMNINDWYLFQGVANVIVFQRIIGPKLMGLQPDEKAIAEALPRGQLVFAELSRLLGSQRYFTGDVPSLADFHLAPQLAYLAITPEWQTLTRATVNLRDWLRHMAERESLKATTWDRVAAGAERSRIRHSENAIGLAGGTDGQ
jgi:glutathione S-transferase